MHNTVLRKTYSALPVCEKEILRYCGCKDSDNEISRLLHSLLNEAEKVLEYKICYRQFPVSIHNDICDLGFTTVQSSALAKNLKNCKSIMLFAATTGLGIDRLIAKYNRTSPSKAVIMQAIGAERTEALCDAFCDDISQEFNLKPRFSPGYGDLPIHLQKDIFSVLDCPRQIGLTLNDSMLMSPSKSVTAIVGITDEKISHINNKCSLCENHDCEFRSK